MKWLLPSAPDVVGLLRAQLAITTEAMNAFAAWAAGDREAQAAVRDAEHRADAAKRRLYGALRSAFVTPLEPEDLFALSRGIDRVVNQAKDAVRESEVMACPPDTPLAEMAAALAAAMPELDAAIGELPHGAPEHADAAIKAVRRVERVYRAAMAQLLTVENLPEVMARRELYRRASRIAEAVEEVAERVLYAMVKEA